LQDQLSKEERDVDKLEEKGLYTLFLTVLGTKEQQLEKERQDQTNIKEKNRRFN